MEESNEHVRKLVQKSLQLIALSYFGLQRLNIRQICEAVSVPDTVGDSLEDDEIIDEYEIIKWCGSLIRKTADGQAFDFAHFSVQEFLTGTCSTHATLKPYHISEGGAQSLLGPLCLKYLLLSNHAVSPIEANDEIRYIIERNTKRHFYEYATTWWPKYVRGHLENKDVSQLLRLFFNKTTNFTSWVLEFVRHCLSNCSDEFYWEQTGFGPSEDVAFTVISAIKRPDFTPLHMASVLGLSGLCSNLLEDGAKLNLESRFGMPLHCAIGGLSVFNDSVPFSRDLNIEWAQQGILLPSESYKTSQFLLDAGAAVSLQCVTPFKQATLLSLSVLSSPIYGYGFCMATELIRAGAVVEDKDVESISSTYEDTRLYLTPEEFKGDQKHSDAIIYMLKITGIPKDDNSPRSRLHSSTRKFAQVMELELNGSTFDLLFDDSARHESLDNILETAIEENDVNTVENCISRTQPDFVKTIKFRGKEEEFPGETWTALHLACYERSRDVLNILLKAGCDTEIATEEGRTPIQLCRYDGDGDTLKILLNHGASSIKQDKNLKTIWHMIAAFGTIEPLKQLTALGPDRDFALRLVSSKGRTPICEALAEKNEEAVLVLLQYCPTAEFWKSDKPLFRQAAQLGSVDVVQKLLSIDVVLDELDAETGSPLHYIAPCATVACVKALVNAFPHRHEQSNGRTPFRSLLARVVDEDAQLDPDIFKVLLSTLEPFTPNVDDTWEFFCSTIVPNFERPIGYGETRASKWAPHLLSHLFDIGVMKCYERDKNQSGLVPFAIALNAIVSKTLPRVVALRNGNWIYPAFGLLLGNWKRLSQAVSEIAEKMTHWDIARTEPSVTQLLSLAIIHDDTGMMQLLLSKGVDPHQRVDKMSALELACISEVPISEANFRILLSYTKIDELNSNNKSVQGLNIVHFTAVGGSQDRGLWKLRQVLAAGAKCNIVTTDIAHESALSFHIKLNSPLTAETLLDFGADPWETDIFGINAVIHAVGTGNTSFLAKTAVVSAERCLTPKWDQTCKTFFDGLSYSNLNSLHIAAWSGQVACLEFYHSENLLSDLEVLDDDLQTPLHYAARFGRLPVIRYLNGRGCNIDPVARDGTTPLHLAVKSGHLLVVEKLLSMGAKSKACNLGLTPLSHAYNGSNLDIINLLRNLEGHVSSSTSPTSSKGLEVMAVAFCNAMKRNNIQACKDIHRQGFPLDYQLISPWPVTPLMFAICNRFHPSMVEWLVKCGSKVSIVFQGPQFPQYLTVLEAAIATPTYNDLLPLLITKYFQEGGSFLRLPRSPLNTAVTSRNHEGLTILLDKLIYQEERGQSSTGYVSK